MSCISELVRNQLQDVDPARKLSLCDIERLAKFSDGKSYFDPLKCTPFQGYVNHNRPRDVCIVFFHKRRKVALHRLLFENYVGPLNYFQYVRHTCGNRYSCVNVLHLKRIDYRNKKSPKKMSPKKKATVEKTVILEATQILPDPPRCVHAEPVPVSLTIHFD